MHSEFTSVPLDRIRYSLVWEDSDTLYHSLKIEPQDHVLVITSAGCNVLNTLLRNPLRVTAIDLNPEQNKLLLFKQYLLQNHNYQTFRALMGFDGPQAVTTTWEEVRKELQPEQVPVWDLFFQQNAGGMLVAGQLEQYLTGFYHTLEPDLQEKLLHLVSFNSVKEQQQFFREQLHYSAFRKHFIRYFDAANLSKGRDPKLFKYAIASCGEIFYNRLAYQLATTLVRNNFFFRFFFFGPENIPMYVLPPCYQAQHFEELRRQAGKLSVVTAEATNYLLSEPGRAITKASLSNIFEYTSPGEFRKVTQTLFAGTNRDLRLVFWNLLQVQGQPTPHDSWQTTLSNQFSAEKACFYFSDSRVLESMPVPVIC